MPTERPYPWKGFYLQDREGDQFEGPVHRAKGVNSPAPVTGPTLFSQHPYQLDNLNCLPQSIIKSNQNPRPQHPSCGEEVQIGLSHLGRGTS